MMVGKRRSAALTALSKAFARWCSQGSALRQPTKSWDGERVRREPGAIARNMVCDGLQRVSTVRSWWSVDFKVERSGQQIRATYLDHGEWYAVPARYGIEPVFGPVCRNGLIEHRVFRAVARVAVEASPSND